jgi:hypothetical protein
LQSAGTTAITVDTSQNVGIGTTSPSYPLQVSKGTTGAVAFMVNPTGLTNFAVIPSNSGSTGTKIGTTGGDTFAFITNNTEQMRIDSAGRVQVAGTTVVDSGRISVTFDSANSTGVSVKASAAAGGTISQYWNSSNTSMGSIACNGTTVTYNSVSDYRLKENITPMTGALAKVLLLKPVTYKWKANGSNGQGFIAHELQDVVPDCVTGEKDAVDSEGNPKYQQVDTSFLVATLTAALQETKALIDTQAETINALTARIVALEQA